MLAWSLVCTVRGLERAPRVLVAESKKETSTSYLLVWRGDDVFFWGEDC